MHNMSDQPPFKFEQDLEFSKIVFETGANIFLPQRVIAATIMESHQQDAWVLLLFQKRCRGFGRDYYCTLSIQSLRGPLRATRVLQVGFHLYAPLLSVMKSARAWVAEAEPFDRLSEVRLLISREERVPSGQGLQFPTSWEKHDLSATLPLSDAHSLP
jgi:hypothetical protein